MRDSVRQSAADSPATGFDRYPAGSVVLCNACAKPIFRLDRAIALGDKAGRMASAFKPLTFRDVVELGKREDIDAGVRALVASWTPDQVKAHVDSLHEFRTGDPMMCPCCDDCFVQVIAVDRHEVLDKAYTIELVTIPPTNPVAVRGKRLGTNHEWIHPGSKMVN